MAYHGCGSLRGGRAREEARLHIGCVGGVAHVRRSGAMRRRQTAFRQRSQSVPQRVLPAFTQRSYSVPQALLQDSFSVPSAFLRSYSVPPAFLQRSPAFTRFTPEADTTAHETMACARQQVRTTRSARATRTATNNPRALAQGTRRHVD